MSYYESNENKTLAELLADPAYQDRNSDITTEDFRQLLAEEITPWDIWYRRDCIKRKAEEEARKKRFDAAVLEKKGLYEKSPTRGLLYRYRKKRNFGLRANYCDYDIDHDWRVHVAAMKAVLNTREHVECSKQGGKAMRRAAAILNRGQGKSKNRGGGKR